MSLLYLYLSGPMLNVPDLNFPEFQRVAKRLRSDGYKVFNPAENYGGDPSQPREYYLRKDLLALLTRQLDGVVLLKGWERSKGVYAELTVARAVGIPVYAYLEVNGGYRMEAVPA